MQPPGKIPAPYVTGPPGAQPPGKASPKTVVLVILATIVVLNLICGGLVFFIFYSHRPGDVTAPRSTADWGKEGLQGKVKEHEETGFGVTRRFGKTTFEKGYSLVRRYNASGYLVETASSFYAPDGALRSQEVYTYDGQGQKLEMARYKADGTLDARHLYTADDRGAAVAVAYAGTEGVPEAQSGDKYKWDSKGQRVELAHYNAEGSLEARYVFKYDDRGNRTEIACYDGGDTLRARHTYKYDDKGNRVEWAFFFINYTSGKPIEEMHSLAKHTYTYFE